MTIELLFAAVFGLNVGMWAQDPNAGAAAFMFACLMQALIPPPWLK
jgi:hypothetical protein